MVLQYRVGNFANGQVGEILPVVRSGASFRKDIHTIHDGNLTVSKRDLSSPGDWESLLETNQTLIIVEDDDLAWNHPNRILGVGYIINVDGNVGNGIQVKFAGMREYLAQIGVTTIGTGTITDPTAGVDFLNATYRESIIALIKRAFTETISTNIVRPQIYNAFPNTATGTKGVSILNSDFFTYDDALEELLEAGYNNEFDFNWTYTSSSINEVKFSLQVQPDNSPHKNSEQTLNCVLDQNTVKLTGFRKTIKGKTNRLIAQTAGGDDEKKSGADFTVKVANVNQTKVNFDDFYNPGVELTTAELTEQMNVHLNSMLNFDGTSELEIIGDPIEWLNNLGKMLNITGGSNIDTTGFNLLVRIVEVEIQANSEIIRVKVMTPQVKYPKLPKRGMSFTKENKTQTNKEPVIRRNKPNTKKKKETEDKKGDGNIDMPPFTLPDAYKDADPIFDYAQHDVQYLNNQVAGETMFQYRNWVYGVDLSTQLLYTDGSIWAGGTTHKQEPDPINVKKITLNQDGTFGANIETVSTINYDLYYAIDSSYKLKHADLINPANGREMIHKMFTSLYVVNDILTVYFLEMMSVGFSWSGLNDVFSASWAVSIRLDSNGNPIGDWSISNSFKITTNPDLHIFTWAKNITTYGDDLEYVAVSGGFAYPSAFLYSAYTGDKDVDPAFYNNRVLTADFSDWYPGFNTLWGDQGVLPYKKRQDMWGKASAPVQTGVTFRDGFLYFINVGFTSETFEGYTLYRTPADGTNLKGWEKVAQVTGPPLNDYGAGQGVEVYFPRAIGYVGDYIIWESGIVPVEDGSPLDPPNKDMVYISYNKIGFTGAVQEVIKWDENKPSNSQAKLYHSAMYPVPIPDILNFRVFINGVGYGSPKFFTFGDYVFVFQGNIDIVGGSFKLK